MRQEYQIIVQFCNELHDLIGNLSSFDDFFVPSFSNTFFSDFLSSGFILKIFTTALHHRWDLLDELKGRVNN